MRDASSAELTTVALRCTEAVGIEDATRFETISRRVDDVDRRCDTTDTFLRLASVESPRVCVSSILTSRPRLPLCSSALVSLSLQVVALRKRQRARRGFPQQTAAALVVGAAKHTARLVLHSEQVSRSRIERVALLSRSYTYLSFISIAAFSSPVLEDNGQLVVIFSV